MGPKPRASTPRPQYAQPHIQRKGALGLGAPDRTAGWTGTSRAIHRPHYLPRPPQPGYWNAGNAWAHLPRKTQLSPTPGHEKSGPAPSGRPNVRQHPPHAHPPRAPRESILRNGPLNAHKARQQPLTPGKNSRYIKGAPIRPYPQPTTKRGT